MPRLLPTALTGLSQLVTGNGGRQSARALAVAPEMSQAGITALIEERIVNVERAVQCIGAISPFQTTTSSINVKYRMQAAITGSVDSQYINPLRGEE